MRDFFFQIVLFLVGLVIGIVTPLLPDKSQQQAVARALAVLLVCVSLVWIGFELGTRNQRDTVNDSPPSAPIISANTTVALAMGNDNAKATPTTNATLTHVAGLPTPNWTSTAIQAAPATARAVATATPTPLPPTSADATLVAGLSMDTETPTLDPIVRSVDLTVQAIALTLTAVARSPTVTPAPIATSTPTLDPIARSANPTARAIALTLTAIALAPTATPIPPTATPTLTFTPTPETGTLWIEPKTGIPFVYVPAGEFIMGSDEVPVDTRPQHKVFVGGFWIMQTEMTNGQYRHFIDAGGYTRKEFWTAVGWKWREENKIVKPDCWDDEQWNRSDYPVVCVNWHQAVAYTHWLAHETGQDIRLPSEAQWEKAARGTDGRIYPWGNDWDGSRLNYCDKNCDSKSKDTIADDGYTWTAPVGHYPQGASPYGVLDMAGNVAEWTNSLYMSYPYQAGDGREDIDAGGERVVRGSHYHSTVYMSSVFNILSSFMMVRTTTRQHIDPNTQIVAGFRVVRVASPP